MCFMRSGALLALAVLSCGGAARAQAPGSAFNPTAAMIQLGGPRGTAMERLRQQQAALQAARTQMEQARARIQVGAASPDSVDLPGLEAQVQQLEIGMQALGREAEREQLQQQLRRPVDVEFQDATVRQAAQALGQASGLGIRVDERVPGDIRFRITAHGIPLYNVLGTLADQSSLMIAPDPEKGGVRLGLWPVLEINGQKQVFVGKLAPWSDDWSGTPDAFAALAPDFPRAVPSPVLTPAVGTPVAPDPNEGIPGLSNLPVLGRLFGGAPAGGASLAVVGERLLVAEPGTGPRGEAGLLLTVYQLDMGRALKKVATAFHPFTAPPAATKRRPPTSLAPAVPPDGAAIPVQPALTAAPYLPVPDPTATPPPPAPSPTSPAPARPVQPRPR